LITQKEVQHFGIFLDFKGIDQRTLTGVGNKSNEGYWFGVVVLSINFIFKGMPSWIQLKMFCRQLSPNCRLFKIC
jgi:hypothetical protein